MINQLERELVILVQDFLCFAKDLLEKGSISQQEYAEMVKNKIAFIEESGVHIKIENEAQ